MVLSLHLDRDRQPELMDDPGIGSAEHCSALAGLGRLNQLSRTASVLFHAMLPFLHQTRHRSLRVLDVATGGGDVAIALAKMAARRHFELQMSGCDISPTAVAYAEQAARRKGVSNMKFFVHDVLSGDFPDEYDVVICSLFLHHLDEAQSILVLQRMAWAAQAGIIVDDLRRTYLGYWLAWAGCQLLSRSPVVHADGPQSVRSAYTPAEIQQLCEAAGLSQTTMRMHWPQRFLMTWKKTR